MPRKPARPPVTAAPTAMLPSDIRLTATRRGNMTTFEYVEYFPAKERKRARNTVKVLQSLCVTHQAMRGIHVTAHADDRGVTIDGTIETGIFGNMMLSEFIAWSPIADRTIRDLMVGSVIGQAVALDPALEEAIE